MENWLWLVTLANVLGVQPEEVALALMAAGLAAVGARLPEPVGAAVRKLSEWLSNKPR